MLAWLILCIGLLATVFASLHVKHGIEQEVVKQFAFTCDQITLKIQERLQAYALILRGGSGLFGASTSVERDEWRAYVEALQAEKSIRGVQGVGFAQVIPADQLASHIAAIRREGFPDYTVRPPGERALYTSIIFLEPFRDRNLRAFGFDMFSEPVRRNAMEQARDTGEAALSGKVELVQETASQVQAGTLMYVPIYRNGAVVDTVERRRAALVGWAYSPYRMNDLMEGIILDWDSLNGKTVDLHIHDGSKATPANLLFDSKPDTPFDLSSLFNQSRMINFNGRPWLLAFNQHVTASGISYMPAWLSLIGGFALSGMLFWLMLSVINTRINAKRIADELTGELTTSEKMLRKTSNRLKQATLAGGVGIWDFDVARNILSWDDQMYVLYGLTRTQFGGVYEAWKSAVSPEDATRIELEMQRALRGEKEFDTEFSVVWPNGAIHNIRAIGSVERDDCGQPVHMIGTNWDITHETEIDRMKSEFLATAAHELRTPMASIFGFTELLLERKFSAAEQREFLGTIYRQSKLMSKITNELLDLARIEARRGKDFIITGIDLRILLQEIVTSFKVPEGRLPPESQAGEIPLQVDADRSKLIQAITNVLSNAYKYSPGGGAVTIEFIVPAIEAQSLPNERASRVGIRITDQGIGMTPEQLARVCERFYRADASGKIPGTGLGMSIVKEIVELHGGELNITSTLGTGTTVTIWLPGSAQLQAEPT